MIEFIGCKTLIKKMQMPEHIEVIRQRVERYAAKNDNDPTRLNYVSDAKCLLKELEDSQKNLDFSIDEISLLKSRIAGMSAAVESFKQAEDNLRKDNLRAGILNALILSAPLWCLIGVVCWLLFKLIGRH